MKNFKLRASVLALAGIALLSLNGIAKADTADDLLRKLHDKGILSDDEYNQFNNERDTEKAQQTKDNASYKNKINLGSYIGSITPEGDIRVRYEERDASGQGSAHPTNSAYEKLNRDRYAWHLGLMTNSDNDFFSEIRFASGGNSRSPNQDFNTSATTGSGVAPFAKAGAALVDRLWFGWKPTEWLTLDAGRMKNLFYTTSLVWDPDITPEGLVQDFHTKLAGFDLNASMNELVLRTKRDEQQFVSPTGVVTQTQTSESKLFAAQLGAHYKFNDDTSAKVAPVLYAYAGSGGNGIFSPGFGTNPTAACSSGTYGTGTAGICNNTGTNNLKVLEIPGEVNWTMAGHPFKVWGDYAYNFDGDKRAQAAGNIAAASGGSPTLNQSGQDTALMLGVQVGSPMALATWEKVGTYLTSANGLQKHDWVGRIWYQRIEAYSLDPNLIDSDVFNAQVNMEGVAASASYMLSDNAFVTLSGAHGTRINSNLGTGGSVDTTIINPDTRYNLLQMDATWRF
jgi:hypothetical protein